MESNPADRCSFFGTQEGEFSLSIKSIVAFKVSDAQGYEPYKDDPNRSETPQAEKSDTTPKDRSQRGWLGRMFGFCVGS